MANENNPQKVQEELQKKNLNQSEKKLTFDPTTGELVVKNFTDAQKADEVVVDQIYKDGFFI
ncbi:MAG: hypothetical protein IPP32_03215 [Bacteroidetes bacterium]|nr:hypothetical protein [Bacteroidota bacterium]